MCETFGLPFLVPERDVEKAERPEAMLEEGSGAAMGRLFYRTMHGPGHKVDRTLAEGDEVAGFRVLDVPGHSRGHVAFWRESDRVLVLGDVLNSMEIYTGIPGLTLPKDAVTADPAENRRSAKRLGELEPALVLFGHGAPVRDARKFADFCAAL